MTKQQFRILILLIFFGLVGYIFYQSPQIILQDLDWPQSIKLSIALCGIIAGILFFTKEKLPPEEKTDKADSQDTPEKRKDSDSEELPEKHNNSEPKDPITKG